MAFWIKHPETKKADATLTFTAYTVIAVVVKFLLSGITIGDFSFGPIDPALVMALLTPTVGAYTAKKWAPKKTEIKE